MGYRILSLKEHGSNSDMREFEEAMAMAKEGFDRVCELAEEMREQYGERAYRDRYGMRGSYGRRHDDWDSEDYGERRRRDSRCRYM